MEYLLLGILTGWVGYLQRAVWDHQEQLEKLEDEIYQLKNPLN